MSGNGQLSLSANQHKTGRSPLRLSPYAPRSFPPMRRQYQRGRESATVSEIYDSVKRARLAAVTALSLLLARLLSLLPLLLPSIWSTLPPPSLLPPVVT